MQGIGESNSRDALSGVMEKRMAFFYGSFMDQNVLSQAQVPAEFGGVWALSGWKLVFTPYANLKKSEGGLVYGCAYRITNADLQKLYAADFVKDYTSMPIELTYDSERALALTFIAVDANTTSQPPLEYATNLIRIGRKYGLPAAYIEQLKGLLI